MNGPTAYIFRVDGIELKGKGAQVTVTPRGQGAVNEGENAVLAYVPSDAPSGTYRVALRVEGQQVEATIAYTWREQVVPAPSATTMATPAATLSGLLLTGRVTVSDTGAAVAGAHVYAVTALQVGVASGDTDASGRYSLRVPAGTYYILFDPPAGSDLARQSWKAATMRGARSAVTVSAAMDGLDASLARGFTVSGRVTSGGAPASAQIRANVPPGGTDRNVAVAETDASGNYQLIVPAGTYYLQVVTDTKNWYWNGPAQPVAFCPCAALTVQADLPNVNVALP